MRPTSLLAALPLAPSFDFNSVCSLSVLSSLESQLSLLTKFSEVSVVPTGSNLTFPDVDPSCVINAPPVTIQSDICRITLQVETSSSSRIKMEAWLPRNWTGRFLSTGNGGLAGCIQYADLAYAVSLGFAAVGANNGHDGGSGAPLAESPEVLADFAYRSIHTNVVIGKNITKEFYGDAHTKSYYLGCSTGGRQGLKSVEDFPEDFDGVVAGAPAVQFVTLLSYFGHFYSEITGDPSQPTFIPGPTWTGLIHDDILAQCDRIDGVQDGIIEDPNTCDYDPSRLLCNDGQTDNCLTPIQVESVRQSFNPFFNSTGDLIFPRAQPGGEDFLSQLANGEPFILTSEWFKYVVYNDSSLDPTKIGLSDYEYAIKQNPFNIETFKGDLRAFDARGGKLLMYHGQVDGLITPRSAEIYYDHASEVSGDLDDYYRLFRISGLGHCFFGPGAWLIGQGAGGPLDADKNILMAAVRWVEEGIAPETIEGVKYVDDDASKGVAFSRKHCRWPLRTTYDGQGDPDKPESWSCEVV
ncbi:hypothetical protein AAF712_008798 [Marasmius tenuissimus]|uniref:Carboxylic ester hydrolase n=1 Tax=Marasmius tenuissimus TaxID=585030 RepID=A0ABR2ZTX3_9AGAR|nr:hypothetical protein PM082_023987 [Marasmius tenuissimus]